MWLFETKEGIIVTITSVLLITVITMLLHYLIASHILFKALLKRTKKEKWARGCTHKEGQLLKMHEEGQAWSERNQAYKKDLHIVNDDLNLYGEYYDFGYDRAVIFVSGRTEGLNYAYYFLQPYRSLGFNVLTIDSRAHGESDGVYNTVGFEEHKDLIAWARLLHGEYGVNSILLHGICIGSSCALMALTSKDCPEYLDGLIADGMYPSFYESIKNHLTGDFHQLPWPTMSMISGWMKHYTGHDIRYGNIDIMDKLNKPLLMIHSKEDRYSLPEDAKKLFDKCPHDKKTIIWYEHGDHSKLRVTDPELYDRSISEFVKKYFSHN